MLLHLRRFLPALLLLAASPWVSAATQFVVAGGTYSSGGYTYPQIGFNPPHVTVNVGDTVTFQNAGGTHNVASDDGTSFRCANGCDGSGGNGNPSDAQWNASITITPAMAGHTLGYHCEIHGSMGMTGTIVVNGSATGGNVPITPGFTGAWYDPTQSGHGIFIEILPNNQILAWWFTFNPDGTQQSWFGNIGAIDPATNTAHIDALQTQGGRWIPNFNPANVTNPPWGSLDFSFTDCNHGRVDFESSVPGYGSGHMDLTRITQIAGLACP